MRGALRADRRGRRKFEHMTNGPMEILYLLIPLSAVLVLGIVAVFGWAVHKGQFEDLDGEAERILEDADGRTDAA
jgi:cbb3-type cytochrome oxidase maturation protein